MAYADVLFLGSVLTMDPAMPRASAAAVRAGKVLAVGSATQLHELAGPDTRVVELGRGCLLPGFHDAHLHLTQYGLEATQLDLSRTPTFDAALELLATRAGALGPEEPLLATGMALNTWGLETIGRAEADALEAAVGGRTTLISSQDHHSNWASGAVLAAAGVRDDTPDPPEGVIVRDDSGRATGLLLEKAQALADDALPAPTRAELRRALQDAGASLAAHGITTVHHMAAEPPSYFRELAAAASVDEYPLRVWACIPHAQLEAAADIGLATGQGGGNFQVGGAKFFADGALGSRTAWMLEPYAGSAGVGMAVDGPEVLGERVPLAVRSGFAPVVHAIGDAAVRAVLDAFETVAAEAEGAGLRPRLEHAQHMHPADVTRAGAMGVVASMQPIHLTFDAVAIARLLPDRVTRAYPFRSLLRSGARLAFGSDAPVASPDVPTGLRAACRRMGADGSRLAPAEAMAPDEALIAYTVGAAYAIGWEGRSGKLTPGYDADLVVLSHDPLVSLDGLEVVATMKAGRFTYGEP